MNPPQHPKDPAQGQNKDGELQDGYQLMKWVADTILTNRMKKHHHGSKVYEALKDAREAIRNSDDKVIACTTPAPPKAEGGELDTIAEALGARKVERSKGLDSRYLIDLQDPISGNKFSMDITAKVRAVSVRNPAALKTARLEGAIEALRGIRNSYTHLEWIRLRRQKTFDGGMGVATFIDKEIATLTKELEQARKEQE